MRYPATPPDWKPLMLEVTRAGFSTEFYEFGQEENRRPDRYLHWDDFRNRAAKSGPLTIEQRWAAIRMGRTVQAQPIPLTDSSGRPFTFFLTQRAFELLHEIDLHCGGGIGVAKEGVIQADTRDNYYVTSIFEEALTSSQLEGAVVTRQEAREIIRKQRKPINSHERMVVNNYRTMRLVSDLKDRDLTADLILTIHREITSGTLDQPEDEGRLRDLGDDVRVVDDESGETFHTPPPASQLSHRLETLCTFANHRGMDGFLHPVIRSILLHFWVAYDHPFVDGNGRTARALFYWSMLRHGFWLAEFFSISHEILKAPKQYYRAFLHTETDGNDLNYFILHQLGIIRASIDALKAYIEWKQSELEGMRKHLGPDAAFNHRQLAILKHALKFPYSQYTVAGHQESHGVSYQTANNDLAQLHQRGLLNRKRISKAFVFSPVPDLPEKLGNAPRP